MKLLNKLTLKNLRLNKVRTIVTIVGIMLSAALRLFREWHSADDRL